MAAELKISGKMSVKTLKENFKNEFGGTLRVYDGRSKGDDNARLASIRKNDDARVGELVCNGHLTVGSFERKMLEQFGIKVQVATPDDWTLALDGITLSKLKDIPEKSSKADMEQFVAYKRKAKTADETAVDNVEVGLKLSDISKDATVWLSFTQNDEDEHLCYLYNIIKDGAMYFVGDNYGEIDDSDLDNYYEYLNNYDCWTENIEEKYTDVECMAEQLVNDFVEARWDEYEYDKGAMANEYGYTITICVGGKKVFEWNNLE